jgi:hypothetical protein
MRYIFGIWTMAVALAVSAVAAYYSIIGLTAIFAAAFIPIVIMGVALEVAKITTAVWLHTFWNEAAFLTKAYLTCAIVVLMLITSMGIFGFLSKAHIEQSASSGGLVAQIERLDQNVLRQQQTIERATTAIDSFGERVSSADNDIQARIEAQERLISDITTRLERDISTQNQLVTQGSADILQQELQQVRSQRTALNSAQQANDVAGLQALVGAKVDSVLGPATSRAISEFSSSLDARQSELIAALELQSDDPAAAASRQEITRLQQTANAEIARAQEAINAFRTQLISVTTVDNTDNIAAQEQLIAAANVRIDELLEDKFALEGELRILEVEVGPVKYIAELVYGETTPDILEESVRWVIVILVLVFDPLAIVLVIAGISVTTRKPIDNQPDNSYNKPEPEQIPESESEPTSDISLSQMTLEYPPRNPLQPDRSGHNKVILDNRKNK